MFSMIYLWLIGAVVLAGADILLGTIYLLIIAAAALAAFIFAVIGEEFGFKGSITVILLEMLITLECIHIARRARDPAGTIIAASMGGLVGIQAFINIGVATFILPTTGLTLPFVSYGLTSLMSLFIGMGFVLNVRLQANR